MRFWIALTCWLICTFSHAETLLVGIPPSLPPFVTKTDNKGHYTGFSIDIMSAVCKYMHAQCQFVPLGFGQTFDQVINNKVDLAIGNFTITPERSQYVLFSLPYLPSDAQFLSLKSNAYTSIDDLKGETIGAEEGSIFVDYVEKNLGNGTKMVSYPLVQDMMDALNAKTIDAVILDKQTAEAWWVANASELSYVGAPFPLGLGLGIMSNKLNDALIARVNQALLNMQSDGTYLKIYNTYFGDTPLVS